jgi:hypothetical protein
VTDKSRKLTQLFSQATPLTGSTPFHSTNARTPPVFVLRASTTRATAQRPSRISLLPACSWAHLSRLATLTRDRLSTSTTTFRPTAANGSPDSDPLSLHARMALRLFRDRPRRHLAPPLPPPLPTTQLSPGTQRAVNLLIPSRNVPERTHCSRSYTNRVRRDRKYPTEGRCLQLDKPRRQGSAYVPLLLTPSQQPPHSPLTDSMHERPRQAST